MMLQPLKSKTGTGRGAIVRSVTLPAPVGGWDASTALTEMPADRAPILDNFIPGRQSVELRRGFVEHATGMTGTVESLMSWNGPSARRLFAVSGTAPPNFVIHDVTNPGPVGAPAVTTLSGKQWQWVNFATSAGHYLWAVNGVDTPRHYDGTTWASPTITGITPNDIVLPVVYKRRLFFVLKDSLNFAYLPADSIAGAATLFYLGGVLRRGGRIVTAGTWSADNSASVDDHIVFITSEGQAAVYTGTDPSSPNAWTLIGVFDLHPPLSVRSAVKAGSDLIVATKFGVVPMSRVLALDLAAQKAVSVTSRIDEKLRAEAALSASLFGWQVLTYPRRGWLIVNVPRPNVKFHQYVMNLENGAWCRFFGMNAHCWGVFNDNLYFGGNGVVYKADTGTNDNGTDIVGDMQTAWSYYGSRGALKRVTMLRANYLAGGVLAPAIEMKSDFDTSSAVSIPTPPAVSVASWDVDTWGNASWSGDTRYKSWVIGDKTGYCFSIRFKVSAADFGLSVEGFDVQFELASPGAFA
jgi:hypothetical protein